MTPDQVWGRLSDEGGSSLTRIDHIEVFPLAIPMTRSFSFASGSVGEAGGTAPHILVRVTASDGAFGWGEGRPVPQWSYETAGSVVDALRNHLGPAVTGLPVADLRGLRRAMHSMIGRGPSVGMPIAKAALDIALHDLMARRCDLTLREFLGGARDRNRVELSWTVTAHDLETLERDAAEGRDEGFRHFNFKAAVSPSTDADIARWLCDNRPEGGFVWADANQGYTLPDARRAASLFLDLGVDLLEQPLPADRMGLMRQLRVSTAMTLAVDEASVGTADFFAYAAEGLVDSLVVKVTRSAGLGPSLQQMAIAEAAGLTSVVSGLTDGLLTKLAACQLAAATGIEGPAALNGSQFIDEGVLYPDKASVEHDGVVELNDEPGIGMEPHPEGLKQYAA